jgi:hypothetical protein
LFKPWTVVLLSLIGGSALVAGCTGTNPLAPFTGDDTGTGSDTGEELGLPEPAAIAPPGGDGSAWFTDGFENAGTVPALVPSNGSRWSRYETTRSANRLQISRNPRRTGTNSFRCYAVPGGTSAVSKAYIQVRDIPQRPLRFGQGQRVVISAWYYIIGQANLQNLTIMDLESESCWPPAFGPTKSPGMRLILSGGNDYLQVERGKIGFPNESIRQNPQVTRFPRNQWVHVEWTVDLSQDPDGFTSVKLNGTEILSGSGVTMPSSYWMGRAIGRSDFQLTEPVYYDKIQFGVTANATPAPVTLYVDDVSIRVIDGG